MVYLLALGSALLYGAADFTGGLTSSPCFFRYFPQPLPRATTCYGVPPPD